MGNATDRVPSTKYSDHVQKVMLVTVSGRHATDPYNDAIAVMDIEHHKVHDGKLFHVSLYSTVTNGVPKYCHFKTGEKIVHLKNRSIVDGTDIILCTFLEDATVTAGTATITPLNMNRNSTNTTDVNVYTNSSGISGGTNLGYQYIPGTNQAASVEQLTSFEWILKPRSNYIFKIENLSVGTATFLAKTWWYDIDPDINS